MNMKIARGTLLALGLACGTALPAFAQDGYGTPSLLPFPGSQTDYGIQRTAAMKRFEAQEAGSGIAAPGHNLNQPIVAAPASPAEPFSPYEQALSGAWSEGDVGCDSCAAQACGSCYPCSCYWVGANFLWMGRDREDFRQLSFDTANPAGSVLNTDSADMNWSGGFEVKLGRWFGCGAWGVEAVYWGIFPAEQEDTVLGVNTVGGLNTVFDFGDISIGGTDVNTLFDSAAAHRVRRSWQFHNVELNLLQGQGYNWDFANDRLNVGLIAGVRYFRFDEGFQYASAINSPLFGADPANEAYYDIDVENHLIGVQLGTNASWYVGSRARLRATPKVGVFNNHINQMQRIYNINGVATVDGGNPFAGEAYDVTTTKNDVSFLAEIDLGVDYRLTRHWSITAGYRAVALTGVGLATSQIPGDFADIDDVRDINSDESIILHGAYAGATFLW